MFTTSDKSVAANLDHIRTWLNPGARVLDLGCGDGNLLATLEQTCQIQGLGIEIDADRITHCLQRGLSVIQQDLNAGLDNFRDASFDLVLMTHALQETKHPAKILQEIVRIGKHAVVSIPNMGHWKCRWQIAALGSMPVSTELPHNWHESENIHLCSLQDFERLCQDSGIHILERVLPKSMPCATLINKVNSFANLFAVSAFYTLSARSQR